MSLNSKNIANHIKIKEVLACYTTPGYIRFIAQADNRLDDVIPVIFVKTPPGKATYIEKDNTITIRMFNRNVSLFASGKIGVTNTPDLEAAKKFLDSLKDLINNAYSDFLIYGKPNQKQIDEIKKNSWLELYHLLPKTNCGECGLPLCSSFAVSVFQGDSKLSDCVLLKDPKYASNLKKLIEKFGRSFLSSLGLDLP